MVHANIVLGGGGAGKSYVANKFLGRGSPFVESPDINKDGTLRVQVEWIEEKTDLVIDTPGLGSSQAGVWGSSLRQTVDEKRVTRVTVVLVMPSHYDRVNELLSEVCKVCKDTLGVKMVVVLWNDKYSVPEVEVTRKQGELEDSLQQIGIGVKTHLRCDSFNMPGRTVFSELSVDLGPAIAPYGASPQLQQQKKKEAKAKTKTTSQPKEQHVMASRHSKTAWSLSDLRKPYIQATREEDPIIAFFTAKVKPILEDKVSKWKPERQQFVEALIFYTSAGEGKCFRLHRAIVQDLLARGDRVTDSD